ncbi:MAG: hypothetical protein IJS15_07615, partial [Victivallales bacterium]|nr:hypothetical protein [Victivallales bacterium]
NYFAASDWTDFIWDDPTILNGAIPVQLTVPEGTPSWEGTKDFIVQIRHKDDEFCIVGGVSETIVEIASKPLFKPSLPSTAFTIYKGLYSSITIPVCPANNMTIDKSAVNLPKGLSLKDNTAGDSPCLTISGKPTAVTSAKKSTITLKDAEGVVSDSLTLTVTVKAMENSAIDISAFTAALYNIDSDIVDASILIQRTKSSLTATITTLDEPAIKLTFNDWTAYDPSSKTLTLDYMDDTHLLYVAVLPDGTGTVTFTTETGIYEGTLYPITTAPSEYDGIYNVAVRHADDSEGFSVGWMQVTAQNGMATISLNLYDEKQPFTYTGCIYDFLTYGYIPFFIPLKDVDEDNCHGMISGVLSIVPSSLRSTTEVDAWISGCGSQYQDRNGEVTDVSPCGTLFNPEKTINECVQSDFYYFFAESPANCIAPSCVKLAEGEDGWTFSPDKSNGFLSSCLAPIVIEPTTGAFTTTLSLLRYDATGLVSKQEVTAAGIIVPTTTPCCSLPDNIAIAYGFYSFNGGNYSIRIMPYQYSQAAAPTAVPGSSTSTKMSVTVTAETKALLYQDLSTENLYFKSWKTSSSTLSIDCTTQWRCTAISKPGSVSQIAESEPTDVLPLKGRQSFTFGFEDGVDGKLVKGWNLIGIPYDLAIPESQELPNSMTMFSPELGAMVRATSLKPGHAYWLYLTKETTFTFQATKLKSPIGIESKPGWSLMAFPGQIAGLRMFQFKNNKFVEIQSQDTRTVEIREESTPNEFNGVWIYKEAE